MDALARGSPEELYELLQASLTGPGLWKSLNKHLQFLDFVFSIVLLLLLISFHFPYNVSFENVQVLCCPNKFERKQKVIAMGWIVSHKKDISKS